MENLTKEEALVLGMSLQTVLIFSIIFAVIMIIAMWKIFSKAGKPGWHSIIPFLNIYDLFDICWKGSYGILTILLGVVMGLASRSAGFDEFGNQVGQVSPAWSAVMGIAALIMFVLLIVQEYKLSKSFGHGFGFFLGLFLLEPIFLIILAFGSSRYIGKDR